MRWGGEKPWAGLIFCSCTKKPRAQEHMLGSCRAALHLAFVIFFPPPAFVELAASNIKFLFWAERRTCSEQQVLTQPWGSCSKAHLQARGTAEELPLSQGGAPREYWVNILYSWTVFSLVTAQFICHLSSPESLRRLQEFSPDWRALKGRFLLLGWTSRVGFIPAIPTLICLNSMGDCPGYWGKYPFGRGLILIQTLFPSYFPLLHKNLFLTAWRWFRNFSLPSDLDLGVTELYPGPAGRISCIPALGSDGHSPTSGH